jgi:methionyl aminopeptidase
LIQIKSKREIELMREAGHILEMTRSMLKEHIKPGINTHQLDILAENYILNLGATPSFKGYHGFPGSICTSINEVVVHGIPSAKHVLKEGDIITLDFGVNYKGYHADSATTYPVGEISLEIKKLLEITEQSLYIGLRTS